MVVGIRWAANRETGDVYVVPRRPGDDDTVAVSVAKALGLLMLLVPWYSLRHPVTTVLVVASVWLWAVHGPGVLLACYVAAAVVLIAWRLAHPRSFTWCVADPFRSRVRGGWVYRRRWKRRMHMCGLSAGWGTDRFAPHVIRVRCDRHTDRIRIKLLPGQAPADLDTRTDALASTFGTLACRVVADKPGVIWLHFTRRDPLNDTVPAIEPADQADLGALPVGVREDGQPWLLRLIGTHLLVVGATGAGKSSVVWSIIRALTPGIWDGSVAVWAIDPKGGIELARGGPVFSRFTYEPDDMVTLVEDAAELVRKRAARMRGVSRLHQPSPVEPFTVLVIDEMAFLTAYMPDRDLTKRLHAALSIVLSQGRAMGVTVIAAVQDPRKEIIHMRDLFPTRIALRLTEAAQIDMVLGQGAKERGAACHQIPESLPGVGYVLHDGQREPTRVRAAHVTDDDITTMTGTHATQTVAASPGHQVSVVPGEVIA